MDLMRSWVDIEEGRGERSAHCMFCECPVYVYNTLRNDFMCKLHELLGDGFECFGSLDSFAVLFSRSMIAC